MEVGAEGCDGEVVGCCDVEAGGVGVHWRAADDEAEDCSCVEEGDCWLDVRIGRVAGQLSTQNGQQNERRI